MLLRSARAFGSQQKLILEHSLRFVPTLGWTYEALCAGAKECGLPPVSHGHIENGPLDLVYFFVDDCNERLTRDAQTMNLERYSLRERIKMLLSTRIGYLIPYCSRWSDAMSLMAHPLTLPSSLEKVALLADDIWYLAGDKSTDHNWYIKRAALGTIYTSTVLFMLSDGSKDKQDTWAFLDRRLEDFVAFTSVQSHAEGALGAAGLFVESLLSQTFGATPSAASQHPHASRASPTENNVAPDLTNSENTTAANPTGSPVSSAVKSERE